MTDSINRIYQEQLLKGVDPVTAADKVLDVYPQAPGYNELLSCVSQGVILGNKLVSAGMYREARIDKPGAEFRPPT